MTHDVGVVCNAIETIRDNVGAVRATHSAAYDTVHLAGWAFEDDLLKV